jgi:magnesium chelatase family protein
MLAAAMNPCPCGHFGNPLHPCSCTPPLIQRYIGRISGPLLDRIDLHVQVPAVPYKDLVVETTAEDSAAIRERVLSARQIQEERLKDFGVSSNALMPSAALRRFCKLDAESEKKMENAVSRQGFSARAYDRILRVSRTMADLENCGRIEARHIAEAIQYRALDGAYRGQNR